MFLRRAIGFWAILGVLLHAAILVRHNAAMVHASQLELAQDFPLGVICRGGSTEAPSAAELPTEPTSPDLGSQCPICTGMMGIAATLPVFDLPKPAFSRPPPTADFAELPRPSLPIQFWPPSRGPPPHA